MPVDRVTLEAVGVVLKDMQANFDLRLEALASQADPNAALKGLLADSVKANLAALQRRSEDITMRRASLQAGRVGDLPAITQRYFGGK